MAKKHLIALLERGYFPEELPPPFTTKYFAEIVDDSLTDYRRKIDGKLNNKWTDYGRHNLAMHGRIRRTLGIPHPKQYFRLSDLIQKNWDDIDSCIRKSSLTKTAPVWADPPNRALIRESDFEDRAKLRAETNFAARYVLQTDVERFFPSIYTHTLPWAVHGKETVKKAMAAGKKLPGYADDLDRQARGMQAGQTVGIPIGPDTSRVLSELVLSGVDTNFSRKHIRNAFRFVDDYEFGFASADEADNCFTAFHESLSEFELSPNIRKTNIHRLPHNLEPTWAVELRSFKFQNKPPLTPRQERHQLEQFFALTTDCAVENDASSVLKFAVGKLVQLPRLAGSNWKYVLSSIANFIVNDPSCIQNALLVYKRFTDAGFARHKVILDRALNAVISKEAPLRHSNYVAWSIWACILLEVRITAANAKALTDCDDVVIALLTLHANDLGLLRGSNSFSLWKTSMTKPELEGRMWLLSYEAKLKGWLNTHGRGDHIAGHVLFDFLRKNSVKFYDEGEVAAWRRMSVDERVFVRLRKAEKKYDS